MIPKLNTAAFVWSLIRDMRVTDSKPGFVLDMSCFASPQEDGCHVCAGGSAVVHGIGADPNQLLWTKEQGVVAHWCDCLSKGCFDYCEEIGFPVPNEVQSAYSQAMLYQDNPDFWQAWESFAQAWEAYEQVEEPLTPSPTIDAHSASRLLNQYLETLNEERRAEELQNLSIRAIQDSPQLQAAIRNCLTWENALSSEPVQWGDMPHDDFEADLYRVGLELEGMV